MGFLDRIFPGPRGLFPPQTSDADFVLALLDQAQRGPQFLQQNPNARTIPFQTQGLPPGVEARLPNAEIITPPQPRTIFPARRPQPAAPGIFQDATPPAAPPADQAAPSAAPAAPGFFTRNREAIGDLGSTIGQVGAGILSAPPGVSFGQGLGQGLARGVQFADQLPDRKLVRQLRETQIDEAKTKAEQRKATLAFAETIKDPTARSLMKLGLTQKAIERLEKIDPAEQQRVIDFEVARQNALIPGKIAVAQAGATRVNVVNQAESAFAKARAESNASFLGKLRDDARSSAQSLAQFQQFEPLLRAVQSGKLAPAQLTLGQFSRALGVKIPGAFDPNQVATGEALQAMTEQLVIPIAKSLGVNPTDRDAQRITDSFPNLSRTVEGNLQILQMIRDFHARKVDQFRRANAAFNKTGEIPEDVLLGNGAAPNAPAAPPRRFSATNPKTGQKAFSDDGVNWFDAQGRPIK